MRKKEAWMFKGSIVLAGGKKVTITKIEETKINGVDYVYYIYCKLEDENISGPYHPSDVNEFSVTQQP